MIKSFSTFLSIIILFMIFSSCDSTAETNKQLQSNWMIIKAVRNGRMTSTLQDGIIRFWHNDSIETNIFGGISKSSYLIDKNTIVSDSELPNFIVNSIGKDTLILETKIKKYQFSFTLIKN